MVLFATIVLTSLITLYYANQSGIFQEKGTWKICFYKEGELTYVEGTLVLYDFSMNELDELDVEGYCVTYTGSKPSYVSLRNECYYIDGCEFKSGVLVASFSDKINLIPFTLGLVNVSKKGEESWSVNLVNWSAYVVSCKLEAGRLTKHPPYGLWDDEKLEIKAPLGTSVTLVIITPKGEKLNWSFALYP